MASSGNFCTMNPLHRTSGNVSYSNGNLTYSPSSSWTTTTWTRGNFVIPKDKKIYMELYHKTQSGYYASYGFATNLSIPTAEVDGNGFVGVYNGAKKVNGTGTNSYMTVPVQGDIVQLAIDGSNNKVWIGLNNTWQGSGDPANGSNETGTINTSNALGYDVTFASTQNSISVLTANFGQDDTFGGVITAAGNADGNGKGVFKYAPPTGFLALCSANLSVSDDIDPAGDDGADENPTKQFNVVLWTGDGSNNRSVSGVGFKPDLLWGKVRSSADEHFLYDSSRGSNRLLPSTYGAEADYSSYWSQFDNDGWTFGNNASSQNLSSATFVGWCWRANGGVTSSNTDGATNSVVQANTKSGFSIVTYTGFSGASGTSTVGHSLQKAPEFIITKSRNSDSSWWVQHVGLSAVTKTLRLDTTAAEGDYSGYGSLSAPTSSVFSINGVEGIGGSAKNYIAYVWHSVEGFSKFGKFEGNSNADGPFVYTGFRPRFFWIKEIDNADDWVVYDTTRDTANTGSSKVLNFDNSYAEDDSSGRTVDVLSNGFKIRTSNSTINASATYIYGAWGDVPFKYNNTF